MNHQDKEKLREEIDELQEDFLSSIKNIDTHRRNELRQELEVALHNISLENQERAIRLSQLIIANLEIKFLSEEKEKYATDLIISNIELVYQNNERSKRTQELDICNRELLLQNEEKDLRTAELITANKELLFLNEEKLKRELELEIANKELSFQNQEKEKRAKELIQAKKNAQESDRLKSAFLANMSHEIRTPMSGILGFSELLKEPHLSGEMQQEYIEIIKKSGMRMLNIINDIISISRIESGQLEANLQQLNINYKIDFIYNFFNTETETKGLVFTVSKPLPEKEAFIISDSEKIYSILNNLVKNAIKYTERGTIALGYVIKTSKQSPIVEFYVKDTGVGIPKNRHKSIFERFRHVNITDKMAFQGAGLGLSISKAYVELLGGKIWVESKKDKGSTFYFTLPYRTEERAEIADKNRKNVKYECHKVTREGQKLNILIVEDDYVSRMLVTTFVKNISEMLFVATNGEEAVAVFKNNTQIDLILMDIQMPVMDGFEATRQIRKFNKDVIIIAQTASGILEDKEKTLGLGCNEYMLKPVRKDNLLALIQKHFTTLVN